MEDYPRQKFEKKWLIEGITPEVVKWAESFGKYLCCKEEPKANNARAALTTGQLRKFFGEVKRIDANYERNQDDIAMLKPLLAYAVGRDKKIDRRDLVNKTRIQEFNEEIAKAIDCVTENLSTKEKFSNFVKLFEAIVAYHKYYGGQESKNK